MLHQIKHEQILYCNRQKVWDFIRDPENLSLITPDSLSFNVLRGLSSHMYPGQIIEYTVRPLLGIRLHWATEITHVKEGEYFVDEQRFGPYTFWHHQHHLLDVKDGVLMRDLVHYKLPLGLLGRLANQIVVRNQLDYIFSYRRNKLDELFNNTNE